MIPFGTCSSNVVLLLQTFSPTSPPDIPKCIYDFLITSDVVFGHVAPPIVFLIVAISKYNIWRLVSFVVETSGLFFIQVHSPHLCFLSSIPIRVSPRSVNLQYPMYCTSTWGIFFCLIFGNKCIRSHYN